MSPQPQEPVVEVVDPLMDPVAEEAILTAQSPLEQELLADTELENSILNILGYKSTGDNVSGVPINPELALAWQTVPQKGLESEVRTGLIKKYDSPSNCKAMDPSRLNSEIKAILSSTTLIRDNRLVSS